jgi:hypothetical protein
MKIKQAQSTDPYPTPLKIGSDGLPLASSAGNKVSVTPNNAPKGGERDQRGAAGKQWRKGAGMSKIRIVSDGTFKGTKVFTRQGLLDVALDDVVNPVSRRATACSS